VTLPYEREDTRCNIPRVLARAGECAHARVHFGACVSGRVACCVLRACMCACACVPAQSADTRPTTPQRRLRTSLYKVVTRIERSTLSQALEKWSVRSHLFARLRRVVKGVIL